MSYEDFKKETIKASATITEASRLLAVSEDYSRGFTHGMREAREIYMKLDEKTQPEK